MNKTIEKIEYYKKNMLDKALEKAKAEYADAEGSYNDTGYDRYWNKMQKLEDEIKELEEYISKDSAISDAVREKEKVRAELSRIKRELGNKLFYLLAAIPECSEARSIKEYLDKL